MLTNGRMTVESTCTVEDENGTLNICTFLATWNDEKQEWTFFERVHDKTAYKEHRVQVREDRAVFEDYVYSLK